MELDKVDDSSFKLLPFDETMALASVHTVDYHLFWELLSLVQSGEVVSFVVSTYPFELLMELDFPYAVLQFTGLWSLTVFVLYRLSYFDLLQVAFEELWLDQEDEEVAKYTNKLTLKVPLHIFYSFPFHLNFSKYSWSLNFSNNKLARTINRDQEFSWVVNCQSFDLNIRVFEVVNDAQLTWKRLQIIQIRQLRDQTFGVFIHLGSHCSRTNQ